MYTRNAFNFTLNKLHVMVETLSPVGFSNSKIAYLLLLDFFLRRLHSPEHLFMLFLALLPTVVLDLFLCDHFFTMYPELLGVLYATYKSHPVQVAPEISVRTYMAV